MPKASTARPIHRSTPYAIPQLQPQFHQHQLPLPTSAISSTYVPQPPNLSTAPAPTSNTAWSSADDAILVSSRAQGLNWGPISQKFNNKTPNACRKRHERIMAKRQGEEWEHGKLEELARAYIACRQEMWEILARKLGMGERAWTIVETKCMEKGVKNLKQAAGRRAQGTHSPPSQSSHDHQLQLQQQKNFLQESDPGNNSNLTDDSGIGITLGVDDGAAGSPHNNTGMGTHNMAVDSSGIPVSEENMNMNMNMSMNGLLHHGNGGGGGRGLYDDGFDAGGGRRISYGNVIPSIASILEYAHHS
ncbi:MAG: hypothetical protein M1834_002736 [Cirrosporium novae-zelandiae]|nr:MAG: hypothetical protein M1834_002736 [Cirrosporium novae-zelandiae]